MPAATRNWPEMLNSGVLETLDQEANFPSSKVYLQSPPVEEQETYHLTLSRKVLRCKLYPKKSLAKFTSILLT
jgi:hypothetical protein